jgi:hypothetical protein
LSGNWGADVRRTSSADPSARRVNDTCTGTTADVTTVPSTRVFNDHSLHRTVNESGAVRCDRWRSRQFRAKSWASALLVEATWA